MWAYLLNIPYIIDVIHSGHYTYIFGHFSNSLLYSRVIHLSNMLLVSKAKFSRGNKKRSKSHWTFKSWKMLDKYWFSLDQFCHTWNGQVCEFFNRSLVIIWFHNIFLVFGGLCSFYRCIYLRITRPGVCQFPCRCLHMYSGACNVIIKPAKHLLLSYSFLTFLFVS